MNEPALTDNRLLWSLECESVDPEVKRRIRRRAPRRGGTCPWLDRAQRALEASDYHMAAVAARRAAEETDETPDVLDTLARAHAGLGDLEDAVIEARRAVRMAPFDPERQLTLAGIFEELRNWDAALHCYERAERLGSDLRAARTGAASVLLRLGHSNRARRIVEALYARDGGTQRAGDDLALALTEVAERVPLVRDAHAYAITASAEVDQMRTLLGQAAGMARDPDLRAAIERISEYVDQCAQPVFVPGRLIGGLLAYGRLALTGTVLAGAVTAGSAGAGWLITGLAAGAGVALCHLQSARVPRWSLNRQAYEAARGPAPRAATTG